MNPFSECLVTLSIWNAVPSTGAGPFEPLGICHCGASSKLAVAPITKANFFEIFMDSHDQLMMSGDGFGCVKSAQEMAGVHRGEWDGGQTHRDSFCLNKADLMEWRVEALGGAGHDVCTASMPDEQDPAAITHRTIQSRLGNAGGVGLVDNGWIVHGC